MKKTVFTILCILVIGCSRSETLDPIQSQPTTPTHQKTFLLFVKIPDPVTPLERGEKYEDPLNEFLIAKSIGEVTGGGSQLSQKNAAGQRSIEWVGIDVEVYDPDKALPLVIEKLRKLGVPEGTVIEQYKPVEKMVKVR